jgi:hypothetical protein
MPTPRHPLIRDGSPGGLCDSAFSLSQAHRLARANLTDLGFARTTQDRGSRGGLHMEFAENGPTRPWSPCNRCCRRGATRIQNPRVLAGYRYLRCLIAIASTLGAMSLGSSAAAGPSPEQLQNRIAGLQRHEHVLQSSIHSDTANLRQLRAPIEDLLTRLHGLEASLAVERRQLDGLQAQLRTARSQLASLQAQLARDLAALRVQLVADYESTPPDLVTVIVDSHGFADLLEREDRIAPRSPGTASEEVTGVAFELRNGARG